MTDGNVAFVLIIPRQLVPRSPGLRVRTWQQRRHPALCVSSDSATDITYGRGGTCGQAAAGNSVRCCNCEFVHAAAGAPSTAA